MALELLLQEPHPAQATILSEAARFNVVDCGRRWGKNILLRDRLIPVALAGHPAAWFAPTYKMLADDWRELKNTLAPVILEKLEVEHRITLLGGGAIDMWSLDQPDAARGRRYKHVAINEAAQVAHLQYAWEQVIRPTLTDYIGDAWFGSTPRGHNYFWKLWMRGQDRAAHPDWRSWKYPTSTNPFIAATEIAQAEGELPQRVFAQEYLAEFVEDAGGLFRNVDAAITAPATAHPSEHKGHGGIALGVDWGKHEDFTVIAGVCRCQTQVTFDRFNKIDYALQRQRLAAIADRWKPDVIWAESNAMGEPIIEELRRSGLPVRAFATTAVSKPPLIEALALAIERGELKLQPHDIQTAELKAIEITTMPSGHVRYAAPEGFHDDSVIALALAWRGICRGGMPIMELIDE